MFAAEPLEPARSDGSGPDGALLAWVGLDRPTEAEFTAVAQQFGLAEAAVAHSLHPHQPPRLERYGDTLFCALRTARYVGESETFGLGEGPRRSCTPCGTGSWRTTGRSSPGCSTAARARPGGYRLSRAVIAFQRATEPLPSMLGRLVDEPFFDEDERRARRDVQVVKKISAWAAILFAPTSVGTIYGMTFRTAGRGCSLRLFEVQKWI